MKTYKSIFLSVLTKLNLQNHLAELQETKEGIRFIIDKIHKTKFLAKDEDLELRIKLAACLIAFEV